MINQYKASYMVVSYSQTNPFDSGDGDGDKSNNSKSLLLCHQLTSSCGVVVRLIFAAIIMVHVDIVAALVGVFVGK